MVLGLCKKMVLSVASGFCSYFYVPSPVQKILDLTGVVWQPVFRSFQRIQHNFSLTEQSVSAHHFTPASDCSEATEEGQRYVIGLLASTALKPNHWQATDFVALHALLDCPEENSSWLCGEEIRTGPGFLLGDPDCDRLIFEPPPFEEIVDTLEPIGKTRKLIRFWATYLDRIRDLKPKLTSDDTLFLVICGHGSDQGPVLLGNVDHHVALYPGHVENALMGCTAKVYLITTACYSGSWTSQQWDLIAAAGVDQEGVSIDSGHFRGGVFTAALLAEHADQHGLRAPKPGRLAVTQDSIGDYSSFHELQVEHDFGPPYQGQQQPMPLLPRKRTSEVLTWLHKLQNEMGQISTAADFPTIQHNNLQPPSQAAPASDSSLLNPQNTEAVLSEDNEEELLSLARDHLQFAPPATLSEVYLLRYCKALVNDQDPRYGSLTAEEKTETLKVLRQRFDYRLLACTIAKKLGWRYAIMIVGFPFTEQRQLDHDLSLQARAAEHGYLLWDLHVFQINTLWKGVAGWLARVWEAAGEPTIDAKKWKETLKDHCEKAGITLSSVQ